MMSHNFSRDVSDSDLLTLRNLLHAETERAAAEFPDPQDAEGPLVALLSLFPPDVSAELRTWLDDRVGAFARESGASSRQTADYVRDFVVLMRVRLILGAAPHNWTEARFDAVGRRHLAEASAIAGLSAIVAVSFDGQVDDASLLRALE